MSSISVIYALIFAAGWFGAMFIALSSRLKALPKVGVIVFLVVLAAAAFYLAGRSGLSPFSFRSEQTLGPAENNVVFGIVGIVGAIAGIIGSYLFRVDARQIHFWELLRPLTFCPVTLIPVIKMVETSNDTTFLGHVLLFCLAYQTGFFWERLLKEGS